MPRGVSLIEALVAMAVMAFGMLAVVGLQATLRQNSDIAKQRSEAVRLAEEAIEGARAFADVGAYGDINTTAPQTIAGQNATYLRSRTVTPIQGGKSVTVQVSWQDRSGQPQSITLNSIIAAIEPALSGRLAMAPVGTLLSPQGRHPAIPVDARNMHDGTSAFKPPGASTVLWVFDNLTGVIVGVCNAVETGQAALTPEDTQACIDSNNGRRGLSLRGYVRFFTTGQPTAADAENPTSSALNLTVALALTSSGHPNPAYECHASGPTAPLTRTTVPYYCVILFNANVVPRWSGISTLVPLAFDPLSSDPALNTVWLIADNAADVRADRYRVCRYTPAANDAQVVPNQDHPRNYTNVSVDEPLTNQNFLVIRAGDGTVAFTCPTDVPADPAHGDFVNSNTLVHQPPPPAP